jgi:hypothetical protein
MICVCVCAYDLWRRNIDNDQSPMPSYYTVNRSFEAEDTCGMLTMNNAGIHSSTRRYLHWIWTVSRNGIQITTYDSCYPQIKDVQYCIIHVVDARGTVAAPLRTALVIGQTVGSKLRPHPWLRHCQKSWFFLVLPSSTLKNDTITFFPIPSKLASQLNRYRDFIVHLTTLFQ